MKSETIIIADNGQLTQYLELNELKPASSLQKLCEQLCIKCKETEITTVTIKIILDLVPASYHGVPAMFANTFQGNITPLYPHAQSYKEDNYLVFRASTVKRLGTFRARVIQACTEGGIYKCSRGKVPKSYRFRPGILKKIIEQELSVKIALSAKKETLCWKVVDKT